MKRSTRSPTSTSTRPACTGHPRASASDSSRGPGAGSPGSRSTPTKTRRSSSWPTSSRRADASARARRARRSALLSGAVPDDATTPPTRTERPQTFTRDLEATRRALEDWLATRRPDAEHVRIAALDIPATNGMSTETLLFDAVWTEEGRDRVEPLVARVAPDPVNVPVFRAYDLEGQFEIMRKVAMHTSVPVPRVHWLERDPAVLGAPFFVMEKRYGVVPPDLMPYPFGGNWLFDASRDDQCAVQNSTIAVIAELHAIVEPERMFPFLDLDR